MRLAPVACWVDLTPCSKESYLTLSLCRGLEHTAHCVERGGWSTQGRKRLRDTTAAIVPRRTAASKMGKSCRGFFLLLQTQAAPWLTGAAHAGAPPALEAPAYPLQGPARTVQE